MLGTFRLLLETFSNTLNGRELVMAIENFRLSKVFILKAESQKIWTTFSEIILNEELYVKKRDTSV